MRHPRPRPDFNHGFSRKKNGLRKTRIRIEELEPRWMPVSGSTSTLTVKITGPSNYETIQLIEAASTSSITSTDLFVSGGNLEVSYSGTIINSSSVTEPNPYSLGPISKIANISASFAAGSATFILDASNGIPVPSAGLQASKTQGSASLVIQNNHFNNEYVDLNSQGQSLINLDGSTIAFSGFTSVSDASAAANFEVVDLSSTTSSLALRDYNPATDAPKPSGVTNLSTIDTSGADPTYSFSDKSSATIIAGSNTTAIALETVNTADNVGSVLLSAGSGDATFSFDSESPGTSYTLDGGQINGVTGTSTLVANSVANNDSLNLTGSSLTVNSIGSVGFLNMPNADLTSSGSGDYFYSNLYLGSAILTGSGVGDDFYTDPSAAGGQTSIQDTSLDGVLFVYGYGVAGDVLALDESTSSVIHDAGSVSYSGVVGLVLVNIGPSEIDVEHSDASSIPVSLVGGNGQGLLAFSGSTNAPQSVSVYPSPSDTSSLSIGASIYSFSSFAAVSDTIVSPQLSYTDESSNADTLTLRDYNSATDAPYAGSAILSTLAGPGPLFSFDSATAVAVIGTYQTTLDLETTVPSNATSFDLYAGAFDVFSAAYLTRFNGQQTISYLLSGVSQSFGDPSVTVSTNVAADTFGLSDSELTVGSIGVFQLSNITNAYLTGTGGGDQFTVGSWSGAAALVGGGGDTIDVSFTGVGSDSTTINEPSATDNSSLYVYAAASGPAFGVAADAVSEGSESVSFAGSGQIADLYATANGNTNPVAVSQLDPTISTYISGSNATSVNVDFPSTFTGTLYLADFVDQSSLATVIPGISFVEGGDFSGYLDTTQSPNASNVISIAGDMTFDAEINAGVINSLGVTNVESHASILAVSLSNATIGGTAGFASSIVAASGGINGLSIGGDADGMIQAVEVADSNGNPIAGTGVVSGLLVSGSLNGKIVAGSLDASTITGSVTGSISVSGAGGISNLSIGGDVEATGSIVALTENNTQSSQPVSSLTGVINGLAVGGNLFGYVAGSALQYSTITGSVVGGITVGGTIGGSVGGTVIGGPGLISYLTINGDVNGTILANESLDSSNTPIPGTGVITGLLISNPDITLGGNVNGTIEAAEFDNSIITGNIASGAIITIHGAGVINGVSIGGNVNGTVSAPEDSSTGSGTITNMTIGGSVGSTGIIQTGTLTHSSITGDVNGTVSASGAGVITNVTVGGNVNGTITAPEDPKSPTSSGSITGLVVGSTTGGSVSGGTVSGTISTGTITMSTIHGSVASTGSVVASGAGVITLLSIDGNVDGSISAPEDSVSGTSGSISGLAIGGSLGGTISIAPTTMGITAIGAGEISSLTIGGDANGSIIAPEDSASTSGSVTGLMVGGGLGGSLSAGTLMDSTVTGDVSGTVSITGAGVIMKVSVGGNVSGTISAPEDTTSVPGSTIGGSITGLTVGSSTGGGTVSGTISTGSLTYSSITGNVSGTVSASGAGVITNVTVGGNVTGTIAAPEDASAVGTTTTSTGIITGLVVGTSPGGGTVSGTISTGTLSTSKITGDVTGTVSASGAGVITNVTVGGNVTGTISAPEDTSSGTPTGGSITGLTVGSSSGGGTVSGTISTGTLSTSTITGNVTGKVSTSGAGVITDVMIGGSVAAGGSVIAMSDSSMGSGNINGLTVVGGVAGLISALSTRIRQQGRLTAAQSATCWLAIRLAVRRLARRFRARYRRARYLNQRSQAT